MRAYKVKCQVEYGIVIGTSTSKVVTSYTKEVIAFKNDTITVDIPETNPMFNCMALCNESDFNFHDTESIFTVHRLYRKELTKLINESL